MTHKDIYTKFMIEYDKANVTSSYPSLTEYEVATVLDKAYNAIIAQKITGNNVRRSGFEADIKSISDLQPLITPVYLSTKKQGNTSNMSCGDLPEDFLYIVEAFTADVNTFHIDSDKPKDDSDDTTEHATIEEETPTLSQNAINSPIEITTHDVARNFVVSRHNLPWVKIPIAYIENKKIYIMFDPIDWREGDTFDGILLKYIRKPKPFAKDVSLFPAGSSYFDGEGGKTVFELNETMAEELISLAISFALENVESPRLNAKLNMRGLEA